MANINDYIILVKEFKRAINSLQVFIGPNMHQDIENIKNHIRTLKHNMILVKTHINKQSRINKIKKHKRKIRKSHKKSLSLLND